MGTIIKLSFLEFKRLLISITSVAVLGVTIASIYLLPPYNNIYIKTKVLLLYIFAFVMAICFSKILSKEFENKTYKSLFTSTLARYQVILYKVLVSLEISLFLMLMYQIFLCFSNFLENKEFSVNTLFSGIVTSIPVFLLYAFIITSFAFLISCITEKFAVTFVVTYICFNDFVKIFLNLVAERADNIIISKIIKYIPFTITTDGFSLQYYSNNQKIWLLIFSFLLLAFSIAIIEKRDYR